MLLSVRLRTETQTALNQWSTAMQEVESYDKTILPSAQQAVDDRNPRLRDGQPGALHRKAGCPAHLIVARGQYLESLAAATNARAQVERVYGEVGSTAGTR